MTRFVRTAALLAAVGLVAGCSSSAESGSSSSPSSSAPSGSSGSSGASSTPPTSAPARGDASTSAAKQAGTPSVLAKNLEVPWGVAFLPDGDALVSERDSHRILRITEKGAVSRIGTVPGVAGSGEGGLLGLAVSPKFAQDRYIYAYFSTTDDNRVVRFTYTSSGLGRVQPVLTGLPVNVIHNGGRIAFGPDGLLYVTVGDAGDADRAPDADYLGGKVLRMTPDGKPAPGNPDPDSVVWTRGHRNPQGLAFGPDGRVYEAEFGQNSEDEINLLRGGKDYGWPQVEGDRGSASGKTAPLRTFKTSDASPSGLLYAGGALWLAALGGERLYRIPVRADGGLGAPKAMFTGQFGRLRTVVAAADGSLWLTTSNQDGRGNPAATDDRIIRVPLR